MKRILLTTITEADVCSASFCKSVAQTVHLGLLNEVDIRLLCIPSDGNWSMAFNKGLTTAWSEKLDGFLCVHPRVSWDAKSLLEVLSTKYDAVAMPVSTKSGFDITLGEPSRIQEDPFTGEIKVQAASLDFFYIGAYGVDRLCTTHPTVSYQTERIKMVLQSGDIYDKFLNPFDLLAYRLREQGIEIRVSSRHTAHRQDVMNHEINFEEVLIRLRANE